MDAPILALTGGTGFVGAHLRAAAVAAGWQVAALARRPQPPEPGVRWVPGDLDTPAALAGLARGAAALIHAAAVVNPLDPAGFARVNVDGTRAVLAASAAVPRFVQVSSLAAREPALSRYGASKAAADALVAARPNAAILRPPGVYGPGDRDMLALFRAARAGFVPVPGGGGRVSLIHVADLCAALLALAGGAATGVYECDDGHPGGYTHGELARAVGRAVGTRPLVLPIPAPLLRAAGRAATALARHAPPRLSADRARYLAHPDWTADSAPLTAASGWRPCLPLAAGLAETAGWYRAAGWLRPSR